MWVLLRPMNGRREWIILLTAVNSTLFVVLSLCIRYQRVPGIDPLCGLTLIAFCACGMALLYVINSGDR